MALRLKSGLQWLTNAFGVRDRAKVALAYSELLQGDRGKLIVADLARYCNVAKSSFVPGDPHQTAFNEGARDAFLHVLEMAGLDPADFPELMEIS